MLGKEKKERLIKTLEVKNFKEDVKCSSIIINEVKRIHSHPKDSSKKPETFWPLGVCFILTTFGMDPPGSGVFERTSECNKTRRLCRGGVFCSLLGLKRSILKQRMIFSFLYCFYVPMVV
jgi:hypothetical protein